MKITFLGTGSGAPSRHRNVSAFAVQREQQSGAWLFDCGEGTQHQIMRSELRLSQIDRIFVTHMHGDHIFGLPGLLASRSLQAGMETAVTVYGPPGMHDYLRGTFEVSQSRPSYPLHIVTVTAGLVFEDARTQVVCAPVSHRTPAFAYAVIERDLPGRFDVARARALGIQPGPIYARLKAGEKATLEDGRVIDGAMLTGATRCGRRLVYSGDTGYTRTMVDLARGASVLIHEATFLDEDAAHADRAAHSTAASAARVAKQAGAETLILTHVSARYEGEGNRLGDLLAEARAVFPNTILARDLWSYEIAGESAPGTEVPV